MRIAFLGKGGSGKTTLAAGFIQYLSQQKQHVLAVDADINMHLAELLQVASPPIQLSKHFTDILAFLEGENSIYKEKNLAFIPSMGSIPPSLSSRFIQVKKTDPFLKQFGVQTDSVTLLTVGTFDSNDVGSSCYHGKLNSLEIVLHHLLDSKEDIIVADTTAGVDNVGTSLVMAYDLLIFVVEPTRKSLSVYSEFVSLMKKVSYAIPIKVVVNKVLDKSDRDFVKTIVPEKDIVGYVSVSETIQKVDQGEKDVFTTFVQDNESLFGNILRQTKERERDWDTYLSLLRSFYQKECKAMWNEYYKLPLDTYIDTTFSYRSVLPKEGGK